MANISVVALPYDSGRWNERMGRGPTDLLENGLAECLRSQQHDVEVRTVRLSERLHSEGQALVGLQNLAVPIVREALAGERRVLILSGNLRTRGPQRNRRPQSADDRRSLVRCAR
jgi:hypothetical protein